MIKKEIKRNLRWACYMSILFGVEIYGIMFGISSGNLFTTVFNAVMSIVTLLLMYSFLRKVNEFIDKQDD